jgi:hypothetical protein
MGNQNTKRLNLPPENHTSKNVQTSQALIVYQGASTRTKVWEGRTAKVQWVVDQIHLKHKRQVETDSLRFSKLEIHILAGVLATTSSLTELVLSNCMIDDYGASQLAVGLQNPGI